MKKLLMLGVVVFLLSNVYAQNEKLFSKVYTKKKGGTPIFFKVDENASIPEQQAENIIKETYNFSPTESLKLIKTESDELGFTHKRYQLLQNGVEVFGGILIAHIKNGKLYSINGKYFNTPLKSSNISSEQALENALNEVDAKKYYWELEGEEQLLKKIKNDQSATYFPTSKLVYAPIEGRFSNEFVLTYKFEIYSKIPEGREDVFINAEDGSLVWRQNKLYHANDSGKAVTVYSGVKDIIADSVAPNDYILKDDSRGNGVITLDNQGTTSTSDLIDFHDDDNYWNQSGGDQYAGDAHYGAEAAYDYFYHEHNRNSYNGNGAIVYTYVNYDYPNNAQWNGLRLALGGSGGASTFATMDIVGHELAHGVTEYTANLIYQGESGALNESFSDIFGVSIEARVDSNFNWLIGDQLNFTLRSMENPNAYGDPSTYEGNNWASTSGADNGGVHTNSGVQNYWYYLLVNGGTGMNDNLDDYHVDGIGIEKAGKIAYRYLDVYLSASSDYEEARLYAIEAANDLYGDCSPESQAVTNAWYAVGIGEAFSSVINVDFYSNKVFTCDLPALVKFTNTTRNAESTMWTTYDGTTTALKDLTLSFDEEGEYTLDLTGYNSLSCVTSPKTISKTFQLYKLNEPRSPECEPTLKSHCCGVGIHRFELEGINISSDDASEGYRNFTCDASAILKVGKEYEYEIVVGSAISEVSKIWIDLDNSGTFDDDELVDLILGVYGQAKSSFTIDVSSTIVYNTPLRMRVMSDIISNRNFLPCDELVRGQAEDYSVIVVENDNYQLSVNKEVESNTISMYPNPVDNYLFFSSKNYNEVKIYNAIGKLIATFDNRNLEKIDVSTFERGLYSIQFIDKSENVISNQSFIKK